MEVAMTIRPGMSLLSVCALALAGCNLTPSETSTGDTGTDTTVGSAGDTVAKVQSGAIGLDESVRLAGVIITSPITLKGDGFYIQDAGGGDYSGIFIYSQPGFDGLFLEVGDEITLSGTVAEFYDVTQIQIAGPESIEVTGQAEVTVDLIDLDTVDNWEALEGVLAMIEDATVIDCIQYGQAPVTEVFGIADHIYDFHSEPEASYTSVTGPITFGYETWKILPRTNDDLADYVPGDTGAQVSVESLQKGETPDSEYDCGFTLTDVIVTSPPTATGGDFTCPIPWKPRLPIRASMSTRGLTGCRATWCRARPSPWLGRRSNMTARTKAMGTASPFPNSCPRALW
jgi:hypothetical protein